MEVTGFGSSESASVQVRPDGTATISAGTCSNGQGHATTFAMIVADRLAIPLQDITLAQPDTGLVPSGQGTVGSRSLQIGGNAVRLAAEEVRDRARHVAARMLEAPVYDIVLEDGIFGVRGVTDGGIGWAELAAWAPAHDGGLGADGDFTQEDASTPGSRWTIVPGSQDEAPSRWRTTLRRSVGDASTS